MAGIMFLLGSLYWPFWYGKQEAVSDARKIKQNASRDTLKEKFHRDNAWERGLALLASGGLIFALLYWLLGFGVWFLIAYQLYLVAAFGYSFTTNLNTCRKLPRFYVSLDPRASETDKFMVRGSAKFGMQPQSFSQLAHTSFVVLAFLLLAVVLILKYL